MHLRQADEKNDAAVGGEGPLVVTANRQQGVKLRALVCGIDAKSGQRQFLLAAGAGGIGIEDRQIGRTVMVPKASGNASENVVNAKARLYGTGCRPEGDKLERRHSTAVQGASCCSAIGTLRARRPRS